jgi:hypothetical protein
VWHISTVPLLDTASSAADRDDLAGREDLDLELVVGQLSATASGSSMRRHSATAPRARRQIVSSDFGKLDVRRQ